MIFHNYIGCLMWHKKGFVCLRNFMSGGSLDIEWHVRFSDDKIKDKMISRNIIKK